MPLAALTEDEFRLIAYMRAYADRCGQHPDPGWVREQLCLSTERMHSAAHHLVALGLAEFFEFQPSSGLLRLHSELKPGPIQCDIRLTENGWNFLRRDGEA